MRVFSILFVFLLCAACSPLTEQPLQQLTRDFYSVYSERKDLDQFLSYYAEDAVLEDIINGDRIEGKEALRVFFDWSNPGFKALAKNTLVVEDIITSQNQAVVKGYFTPFGWGEETFEAMYFTTILTFNDADKISKQVDWINYPASLVDYTNRKNANDWIQQDTNE